MTPRKGVLSALKALNHNYGKEFKSMRFTKVKERVTDAVEFQIRAGQFHERTVTRIRGSLHAKEKQRILFECSVLLELVL